MSIRRRLFLSFLVILALFAVNIVIYRQGNAQRAASFDAVERAVERQALVGDIDKAIEYLELAYEARADWLPWIDFDYSYGGTVEPMRDDPRFRDIVARMKLPK